MLKGRVADQQQHCMYSLANPTNVVTLSVFSFLLVLLYRPVAAEYDGKDLTDPMSSTMNAHCGMNNANFMSIVCWLRSKPFKFSNKFTLSLPVIVNCIITPRRYTVSNHLETQTKTECLNLDNFQYALLFRSSIKCCRKYGMVVFVL